MNDHVGIYLDESGDLGFDEHKAGKSDYFTIALLVCWDRKAAKKIKTAVERTLKNKLNCKKNNRRIVPELKGTGTTFAVKKYFFDHLPKDHWEIYTLSICKQGVYSDLTKPTGKQKLYNWLANQLIQKINFPETIKTINLIVDKCKNSKEIKDFNQYLRQELETVQQSNEAPNIFVSIEHEKSHCNKMLQAIDLFCWGIARKVEQSEDKWYQLFQHKIQYEKVYFQSK